LVVLTVISGCLFFLEEEKEEDKLLPYLLEYEEYYLRDPEGAKAEADAYMDKYEEAASQPFNTFPVYPESKYVPKEVGIDYTLYSRFFRVYDYNSVHNKELDRIIKNAYRHIAEYESAGYPYNSYSYTFQRQAIIYYSQLRDMKFPISFGTGAEIMLSFTGDLPFFLCVLILLGSSILTGETNSGALCLVKTTKRGKGATAAAKLAAIPIAVITAVLCARLPVIIISAARIGADVFAQPIQFTADFISCPYRISVIGAEFLRIGIYFICGCFLIYAMLLASTLLRGYAPPFVCGAAFVLISYLARSINYLNPGTVPQYLNLITLMQCQRMFTSFSGINLPIFGSLPYELAVLAVFIPAIFICAVGAFIAYVTRSSLPSEKKGIISAITSFADKLRTKLTNRLHSKRTYRSASVFTWEFKKLYSNAAFLICIILLIVVKCTYVYQYRYIFPKENDKLWEEYMEIYGGEYTEEKYNNIINLRKELSAITSKEQQMRDAYDKGELTREEYGKYLSELSDAQALLEDYTRLREYANKLKDLNAKGYKVYFIYDTGWKYLFKFSNDVFLLAACAILPIFAFQTDRQNGFYPILRTMKKGRGKTFASKCASTLMASTFLAVLFSVVSLARILYNFPLTDATHSAVSLSFYTLEGDGSIIGEAIKLLLIRILSADLASLTVLSLSAIIPSIALSGVISSVLLLIPDVLAELGYSSLLNTYTFSRAISPTVHLGADTYMPSVIFSAVICILLTVTAYRIYCIGKGQINKRKVKSK